MGQITPNMGIYIPAAGETNYDAPFAAGMINIDQHDHSGGPNKGVPIATSGIADGSITYQKLNANVVDTTSGLGTLGGGLANQITTTGLLNSLANLVTTAGLLCKNGSAVTARTITGTAGEIVVTNGDGASGNPTLSLDPIFMSSVMVQYVIQKVSSVIATSAIIPDDDSIPQIGEGTEIMSLSITPKSATNMLVIMVDAQVGISGVDDPACGIAIFQGVTANAIQANQFGGAAGERDDVNMMYTMVAGTTSPITFSVRLGVSNGGATATLNGVTSARKYGGATSSEIIIYELAV